MASDMGGEHADQVGAPAGGRAGQRPAARRERASPRSSSCPNRGGGPGSCGRPACPTSRSNSSFPTPTAARARRRWRRSPSGTSSPTSRGLSHRQFSVDLGAYPLGSCTMKYNPKMCDAVAALTGLADVHPAAPASCTQGWLELLVELEETLCAITGMAAATLQPAAGAAGELAGLLLMRAWHHAHGGTRHKVVIPDSAHGTNPASVAIAGFEVVTVPSDGRGCVDLDALVSVLDEDVAGIMLTNPNTLGLFEEDIVGHRPGGPRRRGPALLRRRQPQRHPRRGAARRHGLRHRPPEPAQDLRHAPRRWRAGRRARGRLGAPGALPARAPPGSGHRHRARRPLRLGDPGTLDRPVALVARQRPRARPRPRLHPRARGRRPAPGGGSSPS